jgi:hypothetical protein
MSDTDDYNHDIKKFSIIINFEDAKRCFFNKDYNNFDSIILNNNLKMFRANYKYSSDKDGAPDYIAKNLVKGFVQNMMDLKKYFMICFRCVFNDNSTYSYPSYWIVNTNDNMQMILGDFYDDFDFELVSDKEQFLVDIRKTNTNNIICESYVH